MESRNHTGRKKTGPHAGHITRADSGVALLLSLVFVALLAVLVFGFIYEMEVDASFAQNQGSDFQAYLAARSAVANGLLLLAEHYDQNLESGMPPVDSLMDSTQWSEGLPFEPLNDATMRTSIMDEYGKINLNALLILNQDRLIRNEPLIQALRQFFALRLDSANDPVDAIIDWLDYGDMDAEEPEGAENDYYIGLENPYPCKNGPMDSIEELLLIKGIIPELYFGDPEQEQLPLSEYLTVHGDWAGRVNVNTASEEVIAAIIAGHTGNMDQAAAQQIHDEARTAPFEDLSRLRQYIPPPPADGRRRVRRPRDGGPPQEVDQRELQRRAQSDQLNRMFRINSNAFRIYGDGLADDIMVRVEAYVFRIPYDDREIEERLARIGPQYSQDLNEFATQLFRILDWKVIQ